VSIIERVRGLRESEQCNVVVENEEAENAEREKERRRKKPNKEKRALKKGKGDPKLISMREKKGRLWYQG